MQTNNLIRLRVCSADTYVLLDLVLMILLVSCRDNHAEILTFGKEQIEQVVGCVASQSRL